MGYDSLIQIGKDLGVTKDNIKHVTNRVAANLPIIEKSLDKVGTLYTYKMEFYTYTDSPFVFLTIRFLPKYVNIFYVEG